MVKGSGEGSSDGFAGGSVAGVIATGVNVSARGDMIQLRFGDGGSRVVVMLNAEVARFLFDELAETLLDECEILGPLEPRTR